jgi:hypothetical protein
LPHAIVIGTSTIWPPLIAEKQGNIRNTIPPVFRGGK